MAMVERSAQVEWEGGLKQGSGRVKRDSNPGIEPISWPGRTSEKAEITSPEELIAAAHAGCFTMALSNVMETNGCTPGHLDVSATCTFDTDAGKITTVKLCVRASEIDLDSEKFSDYVREAEAVCPVSNALRGNVDIQVDAQIA